MSVAVAKHQGAASRTDRLLTEVLREVKFLRKEFSVLIPHENLSEYAHPRRIQRSYEKALREFPIEG